MLKGKPLITNIPVAAFPHDCFPLHPCQPQVRRISSLMCNPSMRLLPNISQTLKNLSEHITRSSMSAGGFRLSNTALS
jgi:hypothetical protein